MKKTFTLDNGFNVSLAFPEDSIIKISKEAGMDVSLIFDNVLTEQAKVIKEQNKDMGASTDDFDDFDSSDIYVLVTEEIIDNLASSKAFAFYKKSCEARGGFEFYSDVLDSDVGELIRIKEGEATGCISRRQTKVKNMILLSDLVGKENLPATKDVLVDNGPYYFKQHVQKFGDPWADYDGEDINLTFLETAAQTLLSMVIPISNKIKKFGTTKNIRKQ